MPARGGEVSRMNGRGGGWSSLSSPHIPSSSSFPLSQNCIVAWAWDPPGKLAGEGSHRAQTALTNHGQAWAVPGWSVADTIPALWAFQNDPDIPMGTAVCGQPGMTVNQCVIRLCIYVYMHITRTPPRFNSSIQSFI